MKNIIIKPYINKVTEAINFANKYRTVSVYNWKETLKYKTVVAFGLGKFFSDTWKRLFEMCNVEYLSDNDSEKWGKKINGRVCIPPNELKNISNVFVIAVVGKYEPVRKQMDDMGIESIHISEMHFAHYLKGIDTKWMYDSIPKIEEALSLLADEKSCEVFTSVFCNKISREISPLTYSQICSDGEYFSHGIFKLSENEAFIDAGAYIGDTVMDFLRCTKGMFDSVYSFELNNNNFKLLEKNMDNIESNIREKIKIYNAGVWYKGDEMWCDYDGDPDGCSIFQEKRGEKCKLVAIDNVIEEDKKITIIKMDIEGAELQALEGANRVITRHKPKLAICLYHRPEDLWEIPLKINEYNEKYKIFIRHHCNQNYTDTVCYAI